MKRRPGAAAGPPCTCGTPLAASTPRVAHDRGALDAATGQPRWSYATGGAVGFPVRSGPAVADGTVYLGSWDRTVYALSAGS
jgi:PQQ-like domain